LYSDVDGGGVVEGVVVGGGDGVSGLSTTTKSILFGVKKLVRVVIAMLGVSITLLLRRPESRLSGVSIMLLFLRDMMFEMIN
tara:strand:- start:146 stop:391 length:246 start_codon:yes stop_codon:yes gene_type:complete